MYIEFFGAVTYTYNIGLYIFLNKLFKDALKKELSALVIPN